MIGATISTEPEVEEKLSNIVSCAKGVMLAEFAFSDVDRLNSFFHIAEKSGKCLAVSFKQAQSSSALRKDAHLNVPDLND
jgi:mRNA degradation ribonuclease J1/J2